MPATVAGIHLGPDTHANRPAANASGLPVGSLYVCSDHDLIYQTDGSAWSTWATIGGGAAETLPESIIDAKGDLIVGDGSDSAVRLAVGTNDQVLTADSSTASGIKWADAAASGGGGGAYSIGDWSGATAIAPTGTVVWTEGRDEIAGRDILSVSYKSVAEADHACLLLPISGSAPLSISTAIRRWGAYEDYSSLGLVFTDGVVAGSNIVTAQLQEDTSANWLHLLRVGTITAISAQHFVKTNLSNNVSSPPHLRLTWVSANTWRLETSPDGNIWTTFTFSDVSFTMTPTHWGFGVTNRGNTNEQLGTFEYFEVG